MKRKFNNLSKNIYKIITVQYRNSITSDGAQVSKTKSKLGTYKSNEQSIRYRFYKY